MEFSRAGDTDDVFALQARRIRQLLAGAALPIVGLTEASQPTQPHFAGLEQCGATVTCVRIVYPVRPPDGPWASVETARWPDDGWSSVPLREALTLAMRQRGEQLSALVWTADDVTLTVDGRPVVGRILHAGRRWWAARCAAEDLEITVLGRDWYPDAIGVETLPDPDPMLRRLGERPPPMPQPEPEPVPEGLRGEPHRALVDAALRNALRHQSWLADGGPVPDLPRYWSALWRAAVERQMALCDQTERAANDAVASVVNHLTTLQSEAAWFRDDARLRERAVAETLLFGTGLSDRVASLPAQQAWLRDTRPHPPVISIDIASRVDADQRWLAAWATWAHDQASPPSPS